MVQRCILLLRFNAPNVTVKYRNFCVLNANSSCGGYRHFCLSFGYVTFFICRLIEQNLQKKEAFSMFFTYIVCEVCDVCNIYNKSNTSKTKVYFPTSKFLGKESKKYVALSASNFSSCVPKM